MSVVRPAISINSVLTNKECIYLGIKGFSLGEIKKISIDFDQISHGNTEEERMKALDKVSDEYKLVGCNWVSPDEERHD